MDTLSCPNGVLLRGVPLYNVLLVISDYLFQLFLPDSVCNRAGHSVTSFTLSINCVWLIVTGGMKFVDAEVTITTPNTVMIQLCICKHVHSTHMHCGFMSFAIISETLIEIVILYVHGALKCHTLHCSTFRSHLQY